MEFTGIRSFFFCVCIPVAIATRGVEGSTWKRIWKHVGPKRYSLFLWQVRHESLKTLTSFYDRGILSSSNCLLCWGLLETHLHVLEDSPETARL